MSDITEKDKLKTFLSDRKFKIRTFTKNKKKPSLKLVVNNGRQPRG